MDRKDHTMHPRLLAKDQCSGGSCPAVYDDDPDLLPEELAVVGKQASSGLAARLGSRVDPGEVVSVIRREIVTEALRPRPEPITLEAFDAQFETFSYTAVRWETLPAYDVPDADPAEELAAFSAGKPWPGHRESQWTALLKAGRRWGKTYTRFRIAREPLLPYLEWELTWGYEPNVAAGESIYVIPLSPDEPWPADLPAEGEDAWLFDSTELYPMHYGKDGIWEGASRDPDPERIATACRARDAAMHRAIPWRAYITSRPDLQRRLAQ
jgi:hypothetical protein